MADAIETALSQISIAGSVGEAIKVNLNAPFTAITEGSTAIDFQANADFAATVGTGPKDCPAVPNAPDLTGTVVVLNGDLPLVRPATLDALVQAHESAGASATLLTAEVPDPYGLGRIVRSEAGFERIVEERDATPAERAIREINVGAYAFEAGTLREALEKLSTGNDQGEEYLTDVLGTLQAAGHVIVTSPVMDATEALAANDRAQLATLRAVLRDRINLIRAGADPDAAEAADTTGLTRQQPGSMGLGTSQARPERPPDWKPPPRPDLMTRGHSRRRGGKDPR